MLLFIALACSATPPLPPVQACADGDADACGAIIDHHVQQLAARFVVEGQPPPSWLWSEAETALIQYNALRATPEDAKRLKCLRPAPACPLRRFQDAQDFSDLSAQRHLFRDGVEQVYTPEQRTQVTDKALAEGKLARVVVQDPEGRPRPWASVWVYPSEPGPSGAQRRPGQAWADLDGKVLATVDADGRARLHAEILGFDEVPAPAKGPYTLPFAPRFELPPVDGPVGGTWALDERELDLDTLLAEGRAARLSDRVVVTADRHPSLYVYVDADTLVSIRDARKMATYSRASAARN